jgi:hypothetical protein
VSGRAAARAATPPATVTRRAAGSADTPRPHLRGLSSAPVPPLRTRRTAPAAGTRSRRAPFVLLVVALLVGTTLGLLVLNTAIAVDSLKATQLKAQNTERAQEVQRLEQQVVSADAPARLAAAAVAAGLVPAGPAAYLVLGPDGRASMRGTPQPAPATPSRDQDGG